MTVNVDVQGKLGRDTNTKELDVINSLNSLVVEVKLKVRIWVMFCRDDHSFGFLSTGLQEVCSEPVESFQVIPQTFDTFFISTKI